jgi:uncharacterized membrane protein
LKPGADLIVSHEGNPLIASWNYGKGKALAYTTDCAPHWAPPEMTQWQYYPALWLNIVEWLASGNR